MEDLIQKGLRLLIDVAILLVILKIFTFVVSNFFKKIKSRVSNIEFQKKIDTLRTIINSTISIIIIAGGVMQILYRFGIDLRPIIATAGVMGVAIGFGAKRLVEDIITGASLILEGQIRVGDTIKVNNITGTVEKVNIKNVILRDIQGTKHYIRNSLIDMVSNYSRDFSYATFDIGVSYNTNITHVIDVIKNLNIKSEDILEPIEIQGLDKFDDSAIIIKFRIKTKPGKQWGVQRYINLLIKQKFDEEKIEIPFPQVVVHNP